LKRISSIDKITALWALSEAGLGGVFHAFKIPFTGLIIAGVSVLFLTLIAHFSNGKHRVMISATIIVLIIKMLISPHTPPTAYFAVLFQGIIGFAIYASLGLNRISIILLSIVALVESGFQKIFTLTIFYGTSIWESLNAFYSYLEGSFGVLTSITGSELLLIIYFSIYLTSAFLFSWMIIKILDGLNEDHSALRMEFSNFIYESKNSAKKKKKKLLGRRTWLFIMLLVIIALLLLFNPDMGWLKAAYVLVRSVVVIVVWYIIAAPFFKYLFERFLKHQKKRFSDELEFVIELFPTLKSVAYFALKRNGPINNIGKLRMFFNDVIYLTLHIDSSAYEQDHDHIRVNQDR
jgi:hypothetical protein